MKSIDLRRDEALSKQPQMAIVGRRNGQPLVRLYINHRTEERTDIATDEEQETRTYTVHVADYLERISAATDALSVAREALAEAILRHDSSSAVDSFSLKGTSMRLDKATRAGLLMRLDAEEQAGNTSTTLWYEGKGYTLSPADARRMLMQLELYASQCYDRTQAHLSAIAQMESVEEILGYDYTAGYPERLEFE